MERFVEEIIEFRIESNTLYIDDTDSSVSTDYDEGAEENPILIVDDDFENKGSETNPITIDWQFCTETNSTILAEFCQISFICK